jgi:class 3 adenylate cyclase
MIGGPDFFGSPVNLASKLGEDIASPGEILISENAFNQIPLDSGFTGKHLSISISGIELKAVSISYVYSTTLLAD